MNVKELQPQHHEAAAELAAARYRALRRQCPSLPSRCEDAGLFWHMLEEQTVPSGVAAFQAGRLVGFLTGFQISDFFGKRAFYSPEWAQGAEEPGTREIVEELYQAASARWLADGCAIHAVTIMAHDRAAIEAWQWLGFGLCAADGLRDLEPVPGGSGHIHVRRAEPQEVAEVTAFGRALEKHMTDPPVFRISGSEDYVEWLQQRDHAAWLAYDNSGAVGCLTIEKGRADGCDIVQDPHTAGIMMAYTRKEARGLGVGTTLLNQALDWARLQGCRRCAVDWEPMNPPANRFWHRWFSPVCYSLMRWIDERLVAHGAESPG